MTITLERRRHLSLFNNELTLSSFLLLYLDPSSMVIFKQMLNNDKKQNEEVFSSTDLV